jgi:hypothetical protein
VVKYEVAFFVIPLPGGAPRACPSLRMHVK